MIGYFAYGAAGVTQALSGSPDMQRARCPPRAWAASRASPRSAAVLPVTTVLLGAVRAAGGVVPGRRSPRRPWDAALFAASPALVLTGLVNWDLLAVACVAGALWAWSRAARC